MIQKLILPDAKPFYQTQSHKLLISGLKEAEQSFLTVVKYIVGFQLMNMPKQDLKNESKSNYYRINGNGWRGCPSPVTPSSRS